MTRIGLECKLYYNTGTYASPTWVEIVNARDVTIPLTKGEADTSRRGSTWRTRRGTLKDASIDFQIVQKDGDATFTALLNSYINGTPIELLALNGATTDTAAEGLRATCEVFNFQDAQALESAVVYDVSAKPTTSANPPAWYEAAGAPD
jgi:hypothetical protein